MLAGMGGRWVECPAVDALGRPISSRYGLAETAEGVVAVMEMAETAGMWRLRADERDPWRATTLGVGMQMAHAVREFRPVRLVMGLGGSATNDGGAGMAAALGMRFLNAAGEVVEPCPARMGEVMAVDASGRLALPEVVAACDVDNPLLGGCGATAVFSPQKGAGPGDLAGLEAALARLVTLSGGEPAAAIPGAGAAGGLGFGLLHFAGARLESGFDLVADLLGLEKRLCGCDGLLTGEGSLDFQSLSGKGPVGLARLAQRLGVPVLAFCGRADEAARASGIFGSIHALADGGLPHEELIARAGELLEQEVERAMRRGNFQPI
jgi:glycerate kinase